MAAAVVTCAVVGIGIDSGSEQKAVAASKTYESYMNVASLGSGLKIEPTLVFEPSSLAEISATASQSKRPASAILTVDEEMNVHIGEDTRSLERAFDSYLKGKFIPVIRLSETTVDPFITFLSEKYLIKDIMAISDDISVIKKLNEDDTAYLVNTVYDLTGTQIADNRYAEWDHIAEANVAGCNILMYDASDANLHVAAEYVEAMTKMCWAYAETETEAVSAIAAGCYGVAAKSAETLTDAVGHFSKEGFARAQYLAAHRGITTYANEQSLVGIMASHNEGATHVEIDIQVTADRQILINHDAMHTGQRFSKATAAQMLNIKLSNYSQRYGDSFASLREVCEMMRYTDVIVIVELKLDNGSTAAVDELKAIETVRDVMNSYPEMKGHWIAITFYSPFAEQMRELLPEIPLAYLGAGASGKEDDLQIKPWDGEHKGMSNVAGKIEFLRKRHLVLDEMMSNDTNATAQNYLARGYGQNTWTFKDLSHFGYKANIATTDKAEACAMLLKEIPVPATLTEAELSAGKATVPCRTYNGWTVDRECEIIVVGREGDKADVLLYSREENAGTYPCEYGIYSRLGTVTVA